MVEDRGPELLTFIWVFNAIGIIAVSLKLFTRAHVIKKLGWDDFFILLSLILILICGCIFSYDVSIGMGKHAVAIPPEQLSLTVKINFIGNPFGVMAYSLPNISVAILLNRILPPNRLRALSLLGLAILQCTIAAISLVILFAQCTPSESLWDPLVPHECLSSTVITGFSYFVGAFSAFTDIVLAIVPTVAFWRLQMKLKTKVGLCILMGLTMLAAICAIIKTTKLNELADLSDFTYDTVPLILWVFIEANVIITAACIPSLRPFMASFTASSKGEGGSVFRRFWVFGSDSSRSLFQLKNQRSSLDKSANGEDPTSESMPMPSLGSGRKISKTVAITTEVADEA